MDWPEECGYLTYRQFLTWQEWFDAEWDRPSRTDYYILQADTNNQRLHSRHPERIKMEPLKFKSGGKKVKKKWTAEERKAEVAKRTAWAQARWFKIMEAHGITTAKFDAAPRMEDVLPVEGDVGPMDVGMTPPPGAAAEAPADPPARPNTPSMWRPGTAPPTPTRRRKGLSDSPPPAPPSPQE